MTHHAPHRPSEVNGFRVGDKIITPLHRLATIVRFRLDGYVTAHYDDASPTLGEVILQAKDLKHAP